MEERLDEDQEVGTKFEEISNSTLSEDTSDEDDESSSMLNHKEVDEDASQEDSGVGSERSVSALANSVEKEEAKDEASGESSSLLEKEAVGRADDDEHAVFSNAPSHRDLSCMSSNPPPVHVPEVRISISNGPKLNSCSDQESDVSHSGRTDRVPLGAIFNSDNAPAQNRWGEELGYKNWLVHLGRRKRCVILILVGFLLWLGFFLVLAISLNQSAGDVGGTNQKGKDPWGDTDARNGAENQSTSSPKEAPTTKPDIPKPEENTTPILDDDDSGRFMTTPQPRLILSDPETTKDTGQKLTEGLVNREFDVTKKEVTVKAVIVSTKPLKLLHQERVEKTTEASDASHKHGLNSTENEALTLPISHTVPTSGYLVIETTQPSSTTAQSKTKSFSSVESNLDNSADMTSTTTARTLTSTVSSAQVDMETLNNRKPNYLIGIGRVDMTGPAADANMMGYANTGQCTGGIHLRQYSRAFIIEDPTTSVRTAFVNIDACMSSTLVKLEVLKALKKKFGDMYTAENLCISGTHTHSTPAGFLQDVLFQISSWGYVDETLTAMVNGIVESIGKAHKNMKPGYILINKGELVGSNINRSPTAYDNNPPDEKAKYKYNVDTEMTLLKFMNAQNEAIGMINWFPVHCTSMNNTNHLISSDNKGYAEILFEKYMKPNSLPGTGEFVAAFAQSNEGDVSPNTNGPHCMNTGEPCDNVHSTCDGTVHECVASGPGKNMFESTKIIGRNQFEKAKKLFESASVQLQGPVKFAHQYVDMTKYEVVLNETTKIKTCKPAMGFSFAAGTTDGPGAFDFKQGDKSGNQFWNVIRNFLHPPSTEQADCHAPKPILLDTGEMVSPYAWQPDVVDTQILQLGQFVVIAVPGEFSTMAGRRLRDTVLEVYKKSDPEIEYEAVIAGLANAYSDYIATYEEYQIQRYEGASTIYGPHTAKAYDQQFEKLAKILTTNKTVKSDVVPPNNKDKLYSFLPKVYFDRAPLFNSFGDVQEDVKESYTLGELVSVRFVGANPRNCLHLPHESTTFLTVEMKTKNGSWDVIHTDADWETKFIWTRVSTITATSDVTVTWETDHTTEPGQYIINHYGCSKSLFGTISKYSGKSSDFTIKAAEKD